MPADRYPAVSDYGVIGDWRTVALVSRAGSVDWCCMPRLDSGSCFGRLLDWDGGGHCSLGPPGGSARGRQEYVEGTMVLTTSFETAEGSARVTDCLLLPRDDAEAGPERLLLRIVEGLRKECELELRVSPRFDYGEVRPALRRVAADAHVAIGGDDGLHVWSEAGLERGGEHDLVARFRLREGERVRTALRFARPHELEDGVASPDPDRLERELRATVRRWRDWSATIRPPPGCDPAVAGSARVLKALTHAPTGAIAAAATTSLPEAVGGERNWDYRYSWVRDSVFCARSLAELGCEAEADGFRSFITRSGAGHADEVQVAFGVGGERRLPEQELEGLEGYRGSSPVRIGNGAAGQFQLDTFGEIVNLCWRWHRRGNSPDDDDWRFVSDIVETVAERWREPDAGIWEWRGEPRHFVHSKAMCWVALDRGLRLAEECMRRAPERRWRRVRDEVREAVDEQGYDDGRGCFLQAFGESDLDSAVLLLPAVGFCDWDDGRMVSTADVLRAELDDDGMLRRHDCDDSLPSEEGAFVASTFWLVECLARQGRYEDAREVFDRAAAAANHLGLFAEELDTASGEPRGNFPQAISHYSHIVAAFALAEAAEVAAPAAAQAR